MASNTPSLMLQISSQKIIDVKPPLQLAAKLSKSKHIGILGTKSAIRSRGLTEFIKKSLSKSIKISKINGSDLVDLVESGKFITNEKAFKKNYTKHFVKNIIRKTIRCDYTFKYTFTFFKIFALEDCFPHIQFIDPGEIVAQRFTRKLRQEQSKKNSLKIFTSGNVKIFER